MLVRRRPPLQMREDVVNFISLLFIFIRSESDSGLYVAKASNGSDSSTCSAQLIVHESELLAFDYHPIPLADFFFALFLIDRIESEEEKKSYAEQNTPYFAVRLKDTEVMENTFLRFMVKVVGEPRPKIEL